MVLKTDTPPLTKPDGSLYASADLTSITCAVQDASAITTFAATAMTFVSSGIWTITIPNTAFLAGFTWTATIAITDSAGNITNLVIPLYAGL